MLQSEIQRKNICQQWEEPPLVSRIIQQQSLLTGPCRAELAATSSVTHRNCQGTLRATICTGRDTESPAKERADHRKKAGSRVLNFGPILPVFRHVGESIQQFGSRNSHVSEPDATVIYAVETHFQTIIVNGNARQWPAFLVADRNDKGVDTVLLSVDFQLCKYDGSFPILSGVADKVLTGRKGRAIENETIALALVTRNRFKALHIRTMTDFSHGKATQKPP